MPDLANDAGSDRREASIAADVARACLRVAPAWDLRSFVAVNPFLGMTDLPIDAAARVVHEGLGASMLPSIEHHRVRWRRGELGLADLGGAARRLGFRAVELVEMLDGERRPTRHPRLPVRTVAEWIDWRRGTGWNRLAIDALAGWCAADLFEPGSDGRRIAPDAFRRWRRHASIDRSLDAAGLRGFRALIAAMPEEPGAAIAGALDELGIDCLERDAYLLRLLSGILGWASQARRVAWVRDRDDPGAVRDLLAARACQDLAISRLARTETASRWPATTPAAMIEDERTRLVLMEAAEDRFVRDTLETIDAAETGRIEPPARPAAQVLFCIDVRSEPMRRHLERIDPEVETIGFAGFFGMPIAWRGPDDTTPRCPALLRPQHEVGAGARRGGHRMRDLVARLVSAPGSSLAMMELGGLAWLGGLLRDLAGRPPRGRDDESAPIDLDGGDDRPGIDLATRVDLAEGLLRGACLLERAAEIVVLCGHASCSANNPHAAGLDCGACGGGGGGGNARVACAILNDPRVRRGLLDRGVVVPTDTRFVAAVHDTSDDTVRILDRGLVPASHRPALDRLEARFARAGAAVRAARAPGLGIDSEIADAERRRAFERRARDWSEVRTEWGLAGNAGFVVAPRSRTRGTDLGGRCFLHEYDPSADSDGAMLEGILAAPVVVASWINLQYLASTVDPEVLGGGDKTLHDRLGTLGVAVGAGGDLGRGLPLQSVHDEFGGWRHEPLRLQVMIAAPRERIEEVLERRGEVGMLVENGWIRIIALDPGRSRADRLVPGEGWEPLELPGGSVPRPPGARPCPIAARS